jgi:hypothetical protein
VTGENSMGVVGAVMMGRIVEERPRRGHRYNLLA